MQDDELLLYYQQELAFIRKLGEQFAAAHPKIAGNLRLDSKSVEDPHVARLMEAFALNNARIRHKIEEDFPEITDSLLAALHPHALSPIPSMSVIQFQPNEKLMTAKNIPAETELVSDSMRGSACFFKTCYPAQLLPITVEATAIASKPMYAPQISAFNDAVGILQLSLRCNQPNFSFANINVNFIRFFINAQLNHAYALHELLFNQVIGIALAHSVHDSQPIILDRNCLQAVGYQEQENLLPYRKRVFMGYRLLTEYCVFPQKFLFFDLIGLGQYLSKFGQNLEIFFYLNRIHPLLEKNLDKHFFKLGCTPIVNLFEKKAEPISLQDIKTEYHVLPDTESLPEATEVYEVKRVLAYPEAGESTEYFSFYDSKHSPEKAYFHLSRKPSWHAQYYPLSGSEVFISFTDLESKKFQPEKSIVDIDLLCTNRDLPMQLPFGGGQPYLKFLHSKQDTVKQISCVTAITPSYRPLLKKGAKWRYVSTLQLNYLSLADDEQGIVALRDLLRVYNFTQAHEFENLLNGLLSVSSHRTMAYHRDEHGRPIYSRGVEIKLSVDERKFADSSLYLFGCVLDYFFSLYVSINSFTQLTIVNRQTELYRFPPRSGGKLLI